MKELKWDDSRKQRTKASCAHNWKRSYDASGGIPPIRPSAEKSYKEMGLKEIPPQNDPWYVERQRLKRNR